MSEQAEFVLLGKRIRELRGKQSRGQFADAFLVAPSSLARWESGLNQPELGFLIRLTSAFGVSLRWLITGEEEISKNGENLADQQLRYLDECDWIKPKGKKTADTSALKKNNHLELLDNKKTAPPTVGVSDAQQEINTLNRELRDLLRENGDLRVDIERKNARIAELERELVRVLKGEEPTDLASAG